MNVRPLLVEKYRPTNLSNYVFSNESVEKTVKKWLNEKEFPNVLFYSGPGQGKSTLSRILVSECGIDPSDIKRINASLVSGIGFIREELEPWMKKASFSKFKVVQLEELDRLSVDAQKALRVLTEEYSSGVRFIATANYPKNIIKELHSRFQGIELATMDKDSVINLVVDIIEQENIVVDDVEILLAHVDASFPDIRKIINSIDACTDETKKLTAPVSHTSTVDIAEWEEIFSSGQDPLLNLNRLCELTKLADQTNYHWFYEVAYNNSSVFSNEPLAIVKISEYLFKATQSANQALHLHAMLLDLLVLQ